MDKNKNNDEIEAKAILLGDTGVGKTSLIKVTIGEKVEENEISTLTPSYIQKYYNIDKIKYAINLWDTAGQEKYRSLSKLFFKGTDIAIIVYDITNKNSFTNLNNWIDAFKENNNSDSKCIFGIVGNKSDMIKQQKIDENEAENYAKSLGIKHRLVSAKIDPYSFINFLEELVKDARENLFKKSGKIFLNIHKNKKQKCKC